MFIGRIKKRVFLITCLAAIVALIIPCPSFGAKSEKKYLITETELQSELMAFADRLASYLHQALRDFERAPGMQEMRPMVQKDVVISSASAIAIAAEPDPGTAILDMVAMVSMDKAGQEGENSSISLSSGACC